jgi:hypothetical protein
MASKTRIILQIGPRIYSLMFLPFPPYSLLFCLPLWSLPICPLLSLSLCQAQVQKTALLKKLKRKPGDASSAAASDAELTPAQLEQRAAAAAAAEAASEDVALDGGGGKLKPGNDGNGDDGGEDADENDDGSGGPNESEQDRTVYSRRFPWKLVVAELVQQCQPKDLVQALSYTAERDSQACGGRSQRRDGAVFCQPFKSAKYRHEFSTTQTRLFSPLISIL